MSHLLRCSALLLLAGLVPEGRSADPTDNPVATFYPGPEGYPSWTDTVNWRRVIDMKTYAQGKTAFEKFEKARDELSETGGVLYYPAGTYDFTTKPPGRGLFLRGGVVIRGEAPAGRPVAADGKLELTTKFVFPFRKRGGGQVPNDWNLIGLQIEKGKKLKDVDKVGIAWVHLVGATVYFGPQLDWGKSWATAGSWMSDKMKKSWGERVPDGTHPFDPFAGGGKKYEGAGKGRFVFGCVFQDAAGLDDFTDPGYGPDGFHTQRYGARVAVYGSRVLVANNSLPRSAKNFKYRQKTSTPPKKGQHQVLFDYGKTCGIDVNKEMLGWARADGTCPGYFEQGVVVRDNRVFNHGHKGYNVSGEWVTIANNRNDRIFLRQNANVYDLGPTWALTLDGYKLSGGASDNLSRAFDLAGRNLWIDGNRFDNTGSTPGNDGEGILCQAHGGTQLFSWAITRNVHTRGTGLPSYMGGWDVDCHGLLVGWNQTPGWVGDAIVRKETKMTNCAFAANKGASIKPDAKMVAKFGVRAPLVADPPGVPNAPTKVTAKVYQDDAVEITWTDVANNEIGFRVERRIGEGKWHAIAYRPPHLEDDSDNPQAWVDFTAPTGKDLTYRVVAINSADDDKGASAATETVRLASPSRSIPRKTESDAPRGRAMTKRVRIGNGCGFWGDNADAPVVLARHGDLDYLTLEYLAELTMSILARQRQRDPQAGYASDFLGVLANVAPEMARQPKLKVITNAGGMNAPACAAKARAILDAAGLGGYKIGVVTGDDLLPRLDDLLAAGHRLDHLDTGAPLSTIRERVVSANAYLGSRPIADALGRGANVVITGRVADACLTVGPAVHEFGWAWDDWDRLASASVAGHVIECGAQATGGLWCNWQETDLSEVGYPIAEIAPDGSFAVSKPPGTGGAVNRETVSEQLLYEVGDASAYFTPDVVADFTSVALAEAGRDVVAVSAARGRPAPPRLKVSIAYRDGWAASGTLVIAGPGAAAKARKCGEIILARLTRAGARPERHLIECLGAGDSLPSVLPVVDAPEVVLRVAVHDASKAVVERFSRELAPLVTSGPPGVTGYTTGRPTVREVFAYWPALIDRDAVTAEVRVV